MRDLVTQAPWQVWPCQVEEIEGTFFRRCRILLLAPDRQVARAFEGDIPEDAWRAMTDGLGLLLICGDLRFTIAVATKTGKPVWLAEPAPVWDGASSNGGEQPGIVEDLIRQAMRDAMGGWLNDNL
ncbi:hypothetical protein ACH4SK_36560 [Streptomyces inhibens]|uniref:hypothetical protein n=1 Tax=Streptomyces inhibens TaxID=2293571 RepID=UPI0037912CDB